MRNMSTLQGPMPLTAISSARMASSSSCSRRSSSSEPSRTCLASERGAVKGTQGALHRGRDTREGRRVAQGVGTRLGGAQTLHEVEEVARIVRLEGDDELLVVEPEGVTRVQVHGRVFAADADMVL